MDIDKLKIKFPNIFWNCIWYFYLYDLDYSIILPYEINIYQKKSTHNAIITPFIITKICPFQRDSINKKDNDNNIKEDSIDKNEINIIKDNNKIKRFEDENKFIIHNNISLKYIKQNFYKRRSMDEFFNSFKSNNKTSLDKFKTPNKNNINKEETNQITNLNISKTISK